ncbi:hypothetical protein EJK80_04540 [Corynebacterium phoceense]|uniref:Uncharacterized protein n=1 Tax=Corynebacterium phoceense TaxID=1686286 RepID=A0A540R7V4_9CORY|nr:hypothetical protein EJK80_04540 [Corynebacterium phoceense]
MTTGEDTHGCDYFTSLFLLPQLCNSTLPSFRTPDPVMQHRFIHPPDMYKPMFENTLSAIRFPVPLKRPGFSSASSTTPY